MLRERQAEELVEDVCQASRDMADKGVRRQVLLLDNFDRVNPWAAVGVADCLRRIFDDVKKHFTFVLAAAGDLDQVIGQGHVTSPLKNVSRSLALLDLEQDEAERLTKKAAQRGGTELSDEEIEQVWEWTLGYPALIEAVVQRLVEARLQDRTFTIEKAVRQALRDHSRVKTFSSALRQIKELTDLGKEEYDPVGVLEDLMAGKQPEKKNRGRRLLLVLGILKENGKHDVVWRNRMIQKFWVDQEIRPKLLRYWRQGASSFQSGTVSAEGSIVVSLLLDLEPLLERTAFDRRRGTDEWLKSLRDLEEQLPEGPFSPWENRDRLATLGIDLDLFRQEVVHQSLMPIYQAQTKDVDLRLGEFLARRPKSFSNPDDARELLEHEWQRWHWTRIQITRDGALHVTLIRDYYYPVPLIQILNELLGLERAVQSGEYLKLSVQWELALAAAEAFFRQVAGDGFPEVRRMEFTWKIDPRLDSHSPYPLRDRHVIYLLRKACNCRAGGRIRRKHRQLIDISKVTQLEDASEEEARQASELVSMLEGVMIRDPSSSSKVGTFPALQYEGVKKSLAADLSSWRDELFVTTLDTSLILYQAMMKLEDRKKSTPSDDRCQVCNDPERSVFRDIHFPQRSTPYEAYWECIMLGIQYIIELRWSARWIVRQTNENLKMLASLMPKRASDREPEISKLTRNLTLCTRLLSHLRDASVPLSIAGSGYAARKYESLIEVCGLKETIRNAEKDIDGLNAFLHHHENQRSQQRAGEVGMVAGLAAIILAVLAILLTMPSMWKDFSDNKLIGNVLGFESSASLGILSLLSVVTLAGLWEVGSLLWRILLRHNRPQALRISVVLPAVGAAALVIFFNDALGMLPVPAATATVGGLVGLWLGDRGDWKRIATGMALGLSCGLCWLATQRLDAQGQWQLDGLAVQLVSQGAVGLVLACVFVAYAFLIGLIFTGLRRLPRQKAK